MSRPSEQKGYPLPKSAAVSKTMRGNTAKNTKPELLLRKALWHAGVRGYRIHCKELPGKPDLCFRSKKVAVFAHGCFWHGCPACKINKPRHNAGYWGSKLDGNVERDKRHQLALESQGWKVVVVWECQIKQQLSTCVQLVQDNIS